MQTEQSLRHSSGLPRGNPATAAQHWQRLSSSYLLTLFSSFLAVDRILNAHLAWFHEQKALKTFKSSIKDKHTEGWSPHLPQYIRRKTQMQISNPPWGWLPEPHVQVYCSPLTPGREKQGTSWWLAFLTQPTAKAIWDRREAGTTPGHNVLTVLLPAWVCVWGGEWFL